MKTKEPIIRHEKAIKFLAKYSLAILDNNAYVWYYKAGKLYRTCDLVGDTKEAWSNDEISFPVTFIKLN